MNLYKLVSLSAPGIFLTRRPRIPKSPSGGVAQGKALSSALPAKRGSVSGCIEQFVRVPDGGNPFPLRLS